eukprot:TRINITY_DN1107_c1_g2_i4.p1 TRINITY_DN1107_c1_g2~~TRINITY_DN1107_c1_g2_i4.p1  ORF type:complete len:186 (-),score=38.54 TRINITY_DN1107_c1_g2_i4:83-616(-)
MSTALHTVKGVILLNSEGKRISCQYYNDIFTSKQAEAAFETKLFSKTRKINARLEPEIILLDGFICVFRTFQDVIMYVIGHGDVNELILADLLNAIHEALSILLRQQLEQRSILENLDILLLVIDEVIDDGIIIESDPSAIVNRIGQRTEDSIPLSEQTLKQAMLKAREKLAENFLK